MSNENSRAASRLLNEAVAQAVVMVAAGEDPREVLTSATEAADLLLTRAAS